MIREHSAGCVLTVRAQPGAKKTAVTGIYGHGEKAALKIALHAPPVDGWANEALIKFLAETFSLPKMCIQLLSGNSSRSKLFLIEGIAAAKAKIIIGKATFPEGHSVGTE